MSPLHKYRVTVYGILCDIGYPQLWKTSRVPCASIVLFQSSLPVALFRELMHVQILSHEYEQISKNNHTPLFTRNFRVNINMSYQ